MYREDQLKACLAGKTILIAGYGREGQSAERLVKRLVPEAQYTIATKVETRRRRGYDEQWHDEWPFAMGIK